MKKIFRTIACVAVSAFALSAGQMAAQDFSAEVDLTSKLIWRGVEMTPAPTLQPCLNFEAGNFCAYACGAYGLDNSYQEFDLGLSFSLGNFTLEVIDYFYPACKYDLDPEAPWFNWFNLGEDTGHQLDFILYYEPEAIPFKAMFSVIPIGDDFLEDGSRAFSSYLELGWYHDWDNNSRLEANVGASILKSDVYCTDGFGLVNCELKYSRTLELGDVEMPLSAAFVVNPYVKQPYLCAGVGIVF